MDIVVRKEGVQLAQPLRITGITHVEQLVATVGAKLHADNSFDITLHTSPQEVVYARDGIDIRQANSLIAQISGLLDQLFRAERAVAQTVPTLAIE